MRVVYGIGVAGIGLANAKMLCRAFGYDFERMRHATAEELTAVDGIGDVLADAWIDYFASRRRTARRWMGFWQSLPLKNEAENTEAAIFAGMTFVITGSVEHFANRKELQAAD